MNKKYIIAVIVILALAVGLAACLRYIIREPAVRFSEPSAFQESAFYLELHSGLFGVYIILWTGRRRRFSRRSIRNRSL